MKIFTASQIKKWDEVTLEKAPINSGLLMARAAESCADWILRHLKKDSPVHLFCGRGNNGGDGFALAQILYDKGLNVSIFLDSENLNFPPDSAENFKAVQKIPLIKIRDFLEAKDYLFETNSVIIDAIFGIGLNRKIGGKVGETIKILNIIEAQKISIDIPSGLFADTISDEDAVIFQAEDTLTFQTWKKAFLHPETGKVCLRVHVLDIGLDKDFALKEPSENFTIDDELISSIYKKRDEFTHKGNFGKTQIVAGSSGKIGAAVLATKAALRTGSGITFIQAPKCGYEIIQSTCPEAMFLSGGENWISEFNVEEEMTLGIGPGLGTAAESEKSFLDFLKNYAKPLVLDADALNILAKNPEALELIPKNSIITPHPKEFERLFGKTANSFERLLVARKKAGSFGIYIILKDHHTQVITPEGEVFYNITGNSGMAKGGSGDVLLGIITSLLSQKYTSKDAALFGVWLHGKAGDLAADKLSKEAMLPTDLIEEIGNVFKSLN
ncbi:NAD(P)H-hydrate dehydratase [Chryseobacterium sp. MP_3.2]|uniref:NAD(P)H-hydrate dehydratase n=1 Tax=Chryseobacterium sp. MP_3.2 TaxID=3071712 RepID=UPI002E015592|nr:hydroxyethylthiazole kinase-like uncharacterized protein yjeF [Chryseobacterium sp. MP_3.2]